MENRKGRLELYSALEIFKIFNNCYSKNEIMKAGNIFLDLKKQGVINEEHCRLIMLRMEIRKRQL